MILFHPIRDRNLSSYHEDGTVRTRNEATLDKAFEKIINISDVKGLPPLAAESVYIRHAMALCNL